MGFLGFMGFGFGPCPETLNQKACILSYLGPRNNPFCSCYGALGLWEFRVWGLGLEVKGFWG